VTIEVFIPRLMDAAQQNAQNNNARMLLSRWSADRYGIRTLCYDEPDPRVNSRSGIHVARLWRRHAWPAHLFLQYLRPYSAVFYPGVTPADVAGVRGRRLLGLRGPIIATLEGLVGDKEREQFYSSTAGHDVYCQRVTKHELKRCDFILQVADHVIAISPFLARMGRARYGDKFSVLPLGVDRGIFHPAARPLERTVGTVVSAGRVTARKRPDVFLDLAERFPATYFKWFGEGDGRQALIAEAVARNITNIEFPGSRPPEKLAEELRAADIFVMPSLCEGVPKVTQEAAACGLPVIIFGFYESPSVEHGRTGYVVWSDEELEQRLVELLGDVGLRRAMSRAGTDMARALDWDLVAPEWERAICDRAGHGGTAEPEKQ
jgi:glycosyltransferase involved in cell wall biosynthesis